MIYLLLVVFCNGNLQIPSDASINQLSGVISSSITPSPNNKIRSCYIYIRGISFSYRFQLVYVTKNRDAIYIDGIIFEEDDATGTSIIVTPKQDKDVGLFYLSSIDKRFSVSFIILFTGIPTPINLVRFQHVVDEHSEKECIISTL